MTVRELIEALSAFAPDTEVIAVWDCVVDWPVKAVIAHDGFVVLDVDKGDGSYTAADLEEFSPAGRRVQSPNSGAEMPPAQRTDEL